MRTWTKERVACSPWQAIPERMAALGLTAEDGMRQVWFVDGNGRFTGGAEAINAALQYCGWMRPLTTLYHIPGIRQLQNSVYRWVAANRHRLPGSTSACKIQE